MIRETRTEWPRVHTCLYSWCSKQKPECERCDKVVALVTGEYRYDSHIIAWIRSQFDGMLSPL